MNNDIFMQKKNNNAKVELNKLMNKSIIHSTAAAVTIFALRSHTNSLPSVSCLIQ